LITSADFVGGAYVISAVCLSVCQQDHCKINQLISLKLGVIIWSTSVLLVVMKSWIRILDHFSTSLNIPEYGILEHFIIISHTLFTKLSKMTSADEGHYYVLGVTRGTGHPDLDQYGNPESNAGSLLVEVRCTDRSML